MTTSTTTVHGGAATLSDSTPPSHALPDATIIAMEPQLFHAAEWPDAVSVYASPLVGSDDPMWTAVHGRLAGREYIEIPAELRRDKSMMFGCATSYLYVFTE